MSRKRPIDPARDLERRYALTPQMREYDRAGRAWVPYLMYFHQPDYHSTAVNTDSRGFRCGLGKDGRRIAELARDERLPTCVLAGGSTVFGIGATSDASTIPSLLSQNGGAVWFNFGGRAFSSTQEFLLFSFYTPYLADLRRVTILSGINNLILYYLSSEYSKDFGSFFSMSEFRPRSGEGKEPEAPSRLRQAVRRLLPGQKAPPPPAPTVSLLRTIEDHERQKNDLLHIYDRDIKNWQLMSVALGFQLSYVLQPLAGWVRKHPSPEETQLFAELDEQQGEAWRQILSQKMGFAQHRFLADSLGAICRRHGVPFLDMNEALSNLPIDGKWLFVDRIHLTDLGNQLVAQILAKELGA